MNFIPRIQYPKLVFNLIEISLDARVFLPVQHRLHQEGSLVCAHEVVRLLVLSEPAETV